MVLPTVEFMPHALTIDDCPVVEVELPTTRIVTEPEEPGVTRVPVPVSFAGDILVYRHPRLITPPLRCYVFDCFI